MVSLSPFFVIVLFAAPVFSEEVSTVFNFTACDLDDQECFSTMNNDFMELSYYGLPTYNILPIDPLYIPNLVVPLNNSANTVLNYQGLTLRGMRNQTLRNFTVDLSDYTATRVTQEDLDITGYLNVLYNNTGKIYSGNFLAQGSALINASYNFNITTNSTTGIKHFEITSEVADCNAIGDVKTSIDGELRDAEIEDKNLFREEMKSVLCKMALEAYTVLIDNISAALTVLEASALVKGL